MTDQNSVIASVSGFEVGTTHHFRAKTVNAFGTTYGIDQAFTTLSGR